jgi:uncharacterized membrane protein YeiH
MLEITDFIGIAAFALSGFLVGVRKRLDLLGIAICSFLTALGGGILRDVLAKNPIAAFSDLLPGSIVLSVFLISLFFKFHRKNLESSRLFVISDTLGLVSFSISGAVAALNDGFNIFGVVLLGFLTAVGGGMIRDTLINEVPFVLKEKFYGTVSIIVSLFLYFFGKGSWQISVIFVLGVILRLIGHEKNWHLPKINI